MKWIVPISILIFFEFVADVFAKNWSLRGGWMLAVAALGAYLLANTFWLFALQNGSGLARGAAIFSVCSAIIAVVLGVLVYKESTNTYQTLGLVLGIVSIGLIFWE